MIEQNLVYIIKKIINIIDAFEQFLRLFFKKNIKIKAEIAF